MMTRSMWRELDAMQSALVVTSTKAGQNVLHDRYRVQTNAVPTTRTNPSGLGTVCLRANVNPLLTNLRSASSPIANAIRLRQRGYSPLTVTFGDCVRHNAARFTE